MRRCEREEKEVVYEHCVESLCFSPVDKAKDKGFNIPLWYTRKPQSRFTKRPSFLKDYRKCEKAVIKNEALFE